VVLAITWVARPHFVKSTAREVNEVYVDTAIASAEDSMRVRRALM
jgi:hypothetical protein